MDQIFRAFLRFVHGLVCNLALLDSFFKIFRHYRFKYKRRPIVTRVQMYELS